MGNTIGRNAPCPCGSGKKYKQCCWITTVAQFEVADFAWRKLRQLEGIVFDQHLIPYAMETLPAEVVELAMADCFPEELPESFDEELLFDQFFLPWFLFNWHPLEDFDIEPFDPELSLAQNYLKYHERKLNSLEKGFIEAMNQSYYSFYTILDVDVEKTLLLKDIMLGTTHCIKERQGTYHLKRGDIVFSRILTLDNQSIFVGMAPYRIPANYHTNLIDFRQVLIEENAQQVLTPDSLRDEFDLELLDYFFDLMITAYNQPLPTILNTDGDFLQFSKTYFALSLTPEEALNKLLPLTLSKKPDEFLQETKLDKAGEIQQIEMPWLKKGNKKFKGWENTVMGHIVIEKGRLILETNSEKRNQQGKKLLSEYLGDNIRFQKTLIESLEQKLKALPATENNHQKPLNVEELPELGEQIAMMAKAHWESWFDERIPALDNKTPRQAAKTKIGREKLEALLLQYENYDQKRDDADYFKADIDYLRKKLALDKS